MYHLKLNFSISLLLNRPIELSSIVKNLQNIEVINIDCCLDILQAKIYCHHKRGFTGKSGIWAQFLGIEGISGELSWVQERSEEDKYKFKHNNTIYITPILKYMKVSIKEKNVANWVKGTNFELIYMVTRLKIAHGPSVNMKNKKWEFIGQLGLQHPGGLLLKVGPKINLSA
ncbi:MAG: hypothetical protein M1839_002140 [Geoglossum umbratile]|nr:MAG: hypothetical protein M1839_002140 [Geoglossum umbratile]